MKSAHETLVGIIRPDLAGHTPGPWTAETFSVLDAHGAHGMTIKAGDDSLCDLTYGEGWDKQTIIANARLIAAAPELLEALQHIVWMAATRDRQAVEDAITSARAAIAKASP